MSVDPTVCIGHHAHILAGGVDAYDQWADGINVACPKSIVRSNLINTPTDGGIVVFGPEVLVENNTIWVESHALLGGIVSY